MTIDATGAVIAQARMLLQQGDPTAAAQKFSELRQQPIQNPADALQFAILALELDEAKDARTRLRRLAKKSVDPQVWLLLGIAALRTSESSESIRALRQALKLRPGWSDASYNLSRAYEQHGQIPQALEVIESAIEDHPTDADLMNQRGLLLGELGRWEESAASHQRGSDLEPEDHGLRYNAAEALLRLGRIDEAWPAFDSRLNLSHARFPKTEAPRWSGESLQGRQVLIWHEQGLGDLLFALRCGPALAESGATLIVRTPRPLQRLLNAQPWITATVEPDEPCPAVDVHLPAMDLLKHPLSQSLSAPHLSAPPTLDAAERAQLGSDSPKIGWIWQGNEKHRDDAERSLPFAMLRKALKGAPGAHVSLQHFDASSAAPDLAGLLDLGPALGDFYDTAAWMMELDHIVSVDTAALHLAAGLGCPTTLLLSRPGDWRWGISAEPAPGYPNLKVEQQLKRGEWAPVLKRNLRALMP